MRRGDDKRPAACEPVADDARPPSVRAGRPYQAPRLRRFGKLAELTLGGNPTGMNDPGGPSSGKF